MADIDAALIKKEIISPGRKYIPLVIGTRVKFHFQTRKCNADQTIIDESRMMGNPMELVLGKKFKLPIWEVIVQKMAVLELAKFTVDKSLVMEYPFVAKMLREFHKPPQERKPRGGCCGMTIQSEGLGYADLDDLMNNPCDLEFIIELLSVELPTEYEKENWQLSDDEKLSRLEDLRIKGNAFYVDKNYAEAEIAYGTALGILEQLMLKEKPYDIDWIDLAKKKLPFLLNYSQCKLIAKDYYTVIEHCTEALKYDPDNVKAYFRRAKAHVGAWNVDNALQDFHRSEELDPKLEQSVAKELKELQHQVNIRNVAEKLKYHNMFVDNKKETE